MLLTCPKCQSGLQVPDGTAAMVRCPACKTVFSPAEGAAPEAEEDEEEREEPRAKKGTKERAAKGGGSKESKAAKKEENRDFDPTTEEDDRKRRRKRRREADEDLTPEEKAGRKAAFQRAAVGVKMIWASFGLFLLSMLLILVFFFQAVFIPPIPYFVTLAGVIGLANWLLAAVGVALCLSGPRAPGHWGYGTAAAAFTVFHLLLLLVLVVQAKDLVAIGQTGDNQLAEAVRWGQLPTRMDATMLYLTVICYRDVFAGLPKGSILLPMIAGLVEMIRTVLIMMLLSCLSRAARDEELAYRCTRAAGIASLGPGILALGMLLLVATLVETNATGGMFVAILLLVSLMGTYAFLMGTMFPAFMAARDVADACDEPFQSLIPQL